MCCRWSCPPAAPAHGTRGGAVSPEQRGAAKQQRRAQEWSQRSCKPVERPLTVSKLLLLSQEWQEAGDIGAVCHCPRTPQHPFEQGGKCCGKRSVEGGKEEKFSPWVAGGDGGCDGKDNAWLWLLAPGCACSNRGSPSEPGHGRAGALLFWRGVSAPALVCSSSQLALDNVHLLLPGAG